MTQPFSYTNRQKKTHYFRAVPTKTGKLRYYITLDENAEDLITTVPQGYEVVEYPYDGKVVIRKTIPTEVTSKEVELVQQAMDELSPVKDFIITQEGRTIAIHISQFNSFYDGVYLTHQEAKENFGDNIHRWKKYDWILSFELKNKKTRNFQVIRKASVRYLAVPIDEGTDLAALAKKYCFHVGRESLLEFWIPGEDY